LTEQADMKVICLGHFGDSFGEEKGHFQDDTPRLCVKSVGVMVFIKGYQGQSLFI